MKTILFIITTLTLTNCASTYKLIEPKNLTYVSKDNKNQVLLEYKYDLLDKKYAKKEIAKGVKLVAVKITNQSEKDLIFGRDLELTYSDGSELYILKNDKVFKTLKQSPASYLWYLLLTPLNFYTTETNSYGYQETTSSTPIGLVLGPGITAGNMIVSGRANNRFKTELSVYNIYGSTIKKGETKYGLIGIKSKTYEALKLKID